MVSFILLFFFPLEFHLFSFSVWNEDIFKNHNSMKRQALIENILFLKLISYFTKLFNQIFHKQGYLNANIMIYTDLFTGSLWYIIIHRNATRCHLISHQNSTQFVPSSSRPHADVFPHTITSYTLPDALKALTTHNTTCNALYYFLLTLIHHWRYVKWYKTLLH